MAYGVPTVLPQGVDKMFSYVSFFISIICKEYMYIFLQFSIQTIPWYSLKIPAKNRNRQLDIQCGDTFSLAMPFCSHFPDISFYIKTID